ncbi:MAG: hypothetical protein GVY29_08845 [Spirochaetes bacterium]|nr:hypothetical protein [Spirochaetota bacterium]
MEREIRVFEALFLIGLTVEKGTFRGGSWPDLAIGGAVLAELALDEQIRLDPTKRGHRVTLRDGARAEHPLLAAGIARIRAARRNASAQRWVSRFSSLKDHRDLASHDLVADGVISKEVAKILWVIPYTRYPVRELELRSALVDRVRTAVMTDQSLDARTASLVGIAHGTKLLNPFFERRELRQRRARIEEIMDGSPVGDATREAVKAVQAAVIASTAAATAAAASSASGS